MNNKFNNKFKYFFGFIVLFLLTIGFYVFFYDNGGIDIVKDNKGIVAKRTYWIPGKINNKKIKDVEILYYNDIIDATLIKGKIPEGVDVLPDLPIRMLSNDVNRWLYNECGIYDTVEKPTVVAVLDTGYSGNGVINGFNAIDFSSDFSDDNGHGTMVGNIIYSISGAYIMPIKVLDKDGNGYMSSVINGIVYAVEHGAKIINISLGGYKNHPYLEQVLKYAKDNNVLVVAAIGNEGKNVPIYPAACENVFAITSINREYNISPFSNYGKYIDFSAFGEDIATFDNNKNLSNVSGTSFACAVFSAQMAYGISKGIIHSFSTSEILDFTVDLGKNGRDDIFGFGYVKWHERDLTIDTQEVSSTDYIVENTGVADEVKDIVNNNKEYRVIDKSYEINIPQPEYKEGLNGVSITIKRFGAVLNPGYPKLPYKTFYYEIPDNTISIEVNVDGLGEYAWLRAQNLEIVRPPLGINKNRVPFVKRNFSVYPEVRFRFLGIQNIAGHRVAAIGIYPVIIREGELYFTPLFKVNLRIYVSDIVKLGSISGYGDEDVGKKYIQNYGEFTNIVSKKANGYSYLIITTNDLADDVLPLAQWKTKKGLRAKIETIEDIRNNYAGADDLERIRNCILDYASSGTKWVLIVGGVTDYEQNYIPIKNFFDTWQAGDNDLVPSDYYFAKTDGVWDDTGENDKGWAPGVYVGRISTGVPSEVFDIVNKIINYERSPQTGNWPNKIMLAAAFFNHIMDYDGQDGNGIVFPETDGAVLMEKIKNDGILSGLTITRLYQEDELGPTVHPHEFPLNYTNFLNQLNSGVGIVNWSGHGSEIGVVNFIWIEDKDGDGYEEFFNNGDAFESKYVDFFDIYAQVNNNGMYPLMYANSCLTGKLDYTNSDCLGEFVLKSVGIAFIGSSRTSYYVSGWDNVTDGLDNTHDYYFFKSLLLDGNINPGKALYISKFEYTTDFSTDMQNSKTHKKNILTYNLFGDPETPIWTSEVRKLSVTHPTSLNMGGASFTVNVSDDNGAIENARVCIMKGDDGSEVYSVGYTDSSGNISFTINTSLEGILYVTVTKHNYLPSETEIQISNSAPEPFSLLSPNNGEITGANPTLDWEDAIDPDGDIITYTLYVDDAPDFDSPVLIKAGLGASEYTIAVSDNLLENHTYYWRVVAIDSTGKNTACTQNSRLFTINAFNEFPEGFNLLGPDGIITADKPTFKWEKSSDPDPGDSIFYRIVYDDNSGFGSPDIIDNLTSTSYTFSVSLNEDTTYYYYIEAVDSNGSVTVSFPNVKSFTINTYNSKPDPPTLISPTDNGVINEFRPTLRISNSNDIDGDSLKYEFWVSSKDTFDSMVSKSGLIDESESGNTEWMVGFNLTEDTTYYWRARAFDGYEYSDWSSVYSFRINSQNSPPSRPAVIYPPSGTHVNTLTPTLIVKPSIDIDNDNLVYNFYLSTDPDFPINNRIASGDISPAGPYVSWTVNSTTLSNNETYYWYVRAFDGNIFGEYSTVASFRINTSNSPPTIPNLLNPGDGDVINTLTPVLYVSASSDPEGDHILYYFEVDTDPNFNSDSLIVSGDIDSTSFTLEIELKDHKTYYWRCRARDANGYSLYSTTYTFYTSSSDTIPNTPTIDWPVSNSIISNTSPALRVINPDKNGNNTLVYYFEVDISPAFNSSNLIQSSDISEGSGGITEFLPGTLNDDTLYYWRCRVYNGVNYSPWCVGSFTIKADNIIPTSPVPISPSNNEIIGLESVVLTVSNSYDGDGDLLVYDFEVDTSRFFDSPDVIRGYGIDGGVINTSFRVDNLNNGTYYWRCRAYDKRAYSNWSDVMTFTIDTVNGIIYQAPHILSYSPRPGDRDVSCDSSIVIEFSCSMLVDTGSDENILDSFSISPSIDGNRVYQDTTHKLIFTPYNNLEPDTEYTVYITGAKSSDGIPMNSISYSFKTAIDILAPASVSDIEIIANDRSVRLSWVNPGDSDLNGILVVRKEGEAPADKADGFIVFNGLGGSLLDVGLENGKTYYYAIYSYDGFYNYSEPVIVSATPEDNIPPIPPLNFQAISNSASIKLRWQIISNDAVGVRVLRKTNGYPVNPADGITVYNGDMTECEDTNVTQDNIYYYAIYSYDSSNNTSSLVKARAIPYGNDPILTTNTCVFSGAISRGKPGDTLFVRDNDGVVCGVFTLDTYGSYGPITVYGDDTSTTDDEGPNNNENITFYLNGIKISGNTPATFEIGLTKSYDLIGVPDITLTINLRTGWNLFGLNVNPADNTLTSVLSGIAGKYEKVIGIYSDGYRIYDINFPNFATLNTIDMGHGYWIKMIQNSDFTITAPAYEFPYSIQLKEGWNLISYWGENPQALTSALMSIAGKYEKVIGVYDGQYRVYDVQYASYSTLNILDPGHGYWIKLNQDAILIMEE